MIWNAFKHPFVIFQCKQYLQWKQFFNVHLKLFVCYQRGEIRLVIDFFCALFISNWPSTMFGDWYFSFYILIFKSKLWPDQQSLTDMVILQWLHFIKMQYGAIPSPFADCFTRLFLSHSILTSNTGPETSSNCTILQCTLTWHDAAG